MMEMHNKLNSSLCFVILCLLGIFQLGFSAQDQVIQMRSSRTPSARPLLGGLRNCKGNPNNGEIESLGRFAVLEHNKKENALLEFARVVNAKEQVVAGMMYHLTLEAIDAGKKRMYEAKVWVKPWMNFKQLQEFKHALDFTTSDLGIKQDGLVLGWRILPKHDPAVHDAAQYAVQTIKQRSNSLNPYKLLDILLAKAKVIENYVKFELLLKVRRGIKEEKFKVVLSKNIEGKFYLDHMEQDYS